MCVLRQPEPVGSVLTFPNGYDTLEYSWVKATAVSVRLWILFMTLQSTNNHRGIIWCRTQFPGPHKGIRHQADGFSGHPNSKEQLNLLCLGNNNLGHGQITNSNSLGKGQIINNPTMRMATIVASLVEVSITLPGLVPKIRSLPKVKT